jgi:hypothetical protein
MFTKFEVLTAALLKLQVLWDVTPYHRVISSKCFRGSTVFQNIGNFLSSDITISQKTCSFCLFDWNPCLSFFMCFPLICMYVKPYFFHITAFVIWFCYAWLPMKGTINRDFAVCWKHCFMKGEVAMYVYQTDTQIQLILYPSFLKGL